MMLNIPLLLGGSSSVGKTTVAVQLSYELNVPCIHLDTYLKAIHEPSMVFLSDGADMWRLSAQELCQKLARIGEVASPYINALVQDARQERRGRIIEGERIHPVLMAQVIKSGQGTGVFIIEEDVQQLYSTLQQRSQRFIDLSEDQKWKVVEMDALFGKWLRVEAEHRALPWEPSRPWHSLGERVFARVQQTF